MRGWVELLLRKPGIPPLSKCEDIMISTTHWLSDYESVGGKLPMAEFESPVEVVSMFLCRGTALRRPLRPGDIINLVFSGPKAVSQGFLLIEAKDLSKFSDGLFRYDSRHAGADLVLIELTFKIPSLAR